MLLDKTQRNDLFIVIQDEGCDPRDFNVYHNEKEWALEHKSWITNGWFVIEDLGDGMMASYKVGEGQRLSLPAVDLKCGILLALSRWLRGSKTDHETPDLWEQELGKGSQMTELLEGQANTPFDAEEQERIAEVVAEVLKQARGTYELPEDQLRLLEAKLDYLVEAAQHGRRIDWVNTAIGAVGGAFAGGILTPDVVHKVLHALGAGLGPLFGHPMPMLGP